MATKDYKAPPLLTEDISYENWKKEIKIWQVFTSVDKKKQAPAIFLTLQGKARDAVLEMDVNTLNADDGVVKLIETLDGLFKKDTLQLAFTTYDNFERFRKPDEMSIKDYIIEFERLHAKTKQHGMELPDGILAYKLLLNANLPEQHERLVKATITELNYTTMKNQLKKIFDDVIQKEKLTSADVKLESSFHASHNFRGRGRSWRGGNVNNAGRYNTERNANERYRSEKFSNDRFGGDKSKKDFRQRNPVDENGDVANITAMKELRNIWRAPNSSMRTPRYRCAKNTVC